MLKILKSAIIVKSRSKTNSQSCCDLSLPAEYPDRGLVIERRVGQLRGREHVHVHLLLQEVLDRDVSHLKQVLRGVVLHDALGVGEVADGGVGNAQLAITLSQAPLGAGEVDVALLPGKGIKKNEVIPVIFLISLFISLYDSSLFSLSSLSPSMFFSFSFSFTCVRIFWFGLVWFG